MATLATAGRQRPPPPRSLPSQDPTPSTAAEATIPRPLPAPTWRSVRVGSGRDAGVLRLCQAGREDPFVFLHGWGLSPRTYLPAVLPLTAAGLTVLAPALPGFGGSDGPPLRAVGLAAMASRVADLLDALHLDRPVFLAGHSLGGGVALRLACDRPDLVRSLTLVNSVGGAPARARPGAPATAMTDRSWWRWAVGAGRELDPRGWLRVAPDLARDFLPNLARKPLTLALSGLAALRASLAVEAAELVDSGLPVLFIWGDHDTLVPPGELGRVVGAMPAEVVAGRHGWLLTEPGEFAQLLHNALVVHAMLERARLGQPLRPSTGAASPAAARLGDPAALRALLPPTPPAPASAGRR